MKRSVVVLGAISILLIIALVTFVTPTQATMSGTFVLEGGINRTEGFVPFVSGTTVQMSTANPYDVVATVYRTDGTLTGVRIEITGQQSWAPWVSSGTGTPTFQAGLWIFQMAFPAEGKIEVGLRASAPTAVDRITVSASDGSGGIEIRQADVAPVGQPPTATPTPTSTVTRTPTATPISTSTSVPPTATPTATATGIPPTATPSPTATVSSTSEPLIVLEGGVNTTQGFVVFDPTSTITITTQFPVDVIATVYNRGEATGARVTVSGYKFWNAIVTGGVGSFEFVGDVDWGVWAFEGSFSGDGPIEMIVHSTTPPPYRPSTPWTIDIGAVPLGTGDWQVRHAFVQNDKWRLFLPIMFR